MIGGIVAALAGAVLLAFGAQFQNRGVGREQQADADSPKTGPGRFLTLVTDHRWLLGSSFLVVAILLQLVGLLLAPLPVVQPLGVLSLVVTALLTPRLAGARLQRRGVAGIVVCVVGTTLFVVVAAIATRSSIPSVPGTVPVLVVLGVLLLLLLAGFLAGRGRVPAVLFAVAGGICFGFVATLMKIVLDRSGEAVRHGGLVGPSTPFTLLVLAGAAAAGLAGMALVQAAYGGGSPEIVVAALTVVDPLVAVSLGIGLLGQARPSEGWALGVLAATEALAIVGVVLMARNPPVDQHDEHRTAQEDRGTAPSRPG